MKVVIIGGVAGGASAAARLRRLDEQAEILLFERGEYISFANCGLPYYIGGTIQKRNKLLLQTPESMKERFNVEVRVQCEVTAIDRARKVVTVLDLTSGKTYEELLKTAQEIEKQIAAENAKKIAKTGDTAMAGLYLLLAAASLAGIAMTAKKKRYI